MRDTERLAILRALLVRVRERSRSSEEPHEQFLLAASRPKPTTSPSNEHAPYGDAYTEAVVLPPPVMEDTQRWSTLLAEDPIFSAPVVAPPRDIRAALAAPPPPPSPDDAPEPSRESLEVLLLDNSLESTLAAAATGAPSEQVPVSQPRSSGHFEDSVARAVETLEASTILTGAGSDLKRRGNLLSTHAKKRDEPRLLRGRTPRSGSAAVPHPAGESATLLPTEGPAEFDEPLLAASKPAAKPSRRLLRIVAIAAVVLGVAVTFGLARSAGRTPSADSASPRTTSATPITSSIGSASGSPSGATTRPSPRVTSSAGPPASAVSSSGSQPAPTPTQPRTNGILRVDSKAPGRVFVQGIDVGPTGAFIELSCGMKFVRIAHETPPPPGQSFPNWVGEAKSVMVPCGQAQHVEFVERSTMTAPPP